MNVGIRVVRGKDWKWKDQDGGEGGLGTVVEVGSDDEQANCPPDCIMVQWDYGAKNSYRVGYEGAYDLRLFDASPIGEYMSCGHISYWCLPNLGHNYFGEYTIYSTP